jgi:hypothetical protein
VAGSKTAAKPESPVIVAELDESDAAVLSSRGSRTMGIEVEGVGTAYGKAGTKPESPVIVADQDGSDAAVSSSRDSWTTGIVEVEGVGTAYGKTAAKPESPELLVRPSSIAPGGLRSVTITLPVDIVDTGRNEPISMVVQSAPRFRAARASRVLGCACEIVSKLASKIPTPTVIWVVTGSLRFERVMVDCPLEIEEIGRDGQIGLFGASAGNISRKYCFCSSWRRNSDALRRRRVLLFINGRIANSGFSATSSAIRLCALMPLSSHLSCSRWSSSSEGRGW